MPLKSEYQRHFVDHQYNVFKEDYEELVEFRLKKKSFDNSHTPIIWMDEDCKGICHRDCNEDGVVINDKNAKEVVNQAKTDESTLNKSIQVGSTALSLKEIGVQSPRCKLVRKHKISRRLKENVLHHETPVISYGCGDKNNPWNKKTFNVKAPKSEVRQSALRAAKQRECNSWKRQTRKEKLISEKLQKQAVLNALTDFNQWQSEYQKQFCNSK